MTPIPLPPHSITALTFLAGHWRSDQDGSVLEEMWLAPSAGVAQGLVRLVQGDRVATIELIIISADTDRVVMRYNHFEPDYRTWETDGPITLTLTSATQSEAVFTNLSSGPRHALEMGYRMTGPASMHSWVKPYRPDGSLAYVAFDYARVA